MQYNYLFSFPVKDCEGNRSELKRKTNNREADDSNGKEMILFRSNHFYLLFAFHADSPLYVFRLQLLSVAPSTLMWPSLKELYPFHSDSVRTVPFAATERLILWVRLTTKSPQYATGHGYTPAALQLQRRVICVLSSERALCMKNKESNCHSNKCNIRSLAPEGARHQDVLADWPSVVMWLRLHLQWRHKDLSGPFPALSSVSGLKLPRPASEMCFW
jgi:hypothetical protein